MHKLVKLFLLPSISGSTNAQIVVNDKTGNVLKQINIAGTAKGTVNIDASTLSAGVYSYSSIIDGKLISTKQMIWQNKNPL